MGCGEASGSASASFRGFSTRPSFGLLIRNTFLISIYGLALGFPAPILLALMLNEIRRRWFKRSVQTVTFAPHFISTVVMVAIIMNFLSPRVGIAGRVMELLGREPYDLLTVAGNFRMIYVLTDIWQHMGYGSIIYIAALSGVDPQLYDAAKIDGATRLQKIRYVDIPAIMPTITILLVLSFGDMMNVGFERIFLMQNPLNLETSEVIATYVYKMGLVNANFSFGTAVGLFNSVINFVLLIIVNQVAKRISETSLW